IFALLAGAMVTTLESTPIRRGLTVITAALFCVICATLTAQQQALWSSSESLLDCALESVQGHWYSQDIYWRLAKLKLDEGRNQEALVDLDLALATNPNLYMGRRLRGLVHYRLGQ